MAAIQKLGLSSAALNNDASVVSGVLRKYRDKLQQLGYGVSVDMNTRH